MLNQRLQQHCPYDYQARRAKGPAQDGGVGNAQDDEAEFAE